MDCFFPRIVVAPELILKNG